MLSGILLWLGRGRLKPLAPALCFAVSVARTRREATVPIELLICGLYVQFGSEFRDAFAPPSALDDLAGRVLGTAGRPARETVEEFERKARELATASELPPLAFDYEASRCISAISRSLTAQGRKSRLPNGAVAAAALFSHPGVASKLGQMGLSLRRR